MDAEIDCGQNPLIILDFRGVPLNRLGIKGNSLNLVKVICENLHNKR